MRTTDRRLWTSVGVATEPRKLPSTAEVVIVGSALRRLGVEFKSYWLILLVVLALMVAATYVQVLIPQLIGQSVDCYLTPGSVSQFRARANSKAVDVLPEPGAP